MTKLNRPGSENLRKKVHELLKTYISNKEPNPSETEMLELVKELDTQLADLELENDALIHEQNKTSHSDIAEYYKYAPSGFYTLSPSGNILELNLYASNLLGLDQPNLLNKQFDSFISNESKIIFEAFLTDIFKHSSRETCEVILEDKSNQPIYLLLTGIISKNKDCCFVTGVDISERKSAENKQRKERLHYQAIIEKAPDGFVLLHANGNFKFISPSAKKMFGFDLQKDVLGNPMDYTHPDDLPYVLSELNKIFENPAYIPTIKYRFRDKKGNWKWIESTMSNLLSDQNVESIVINFRDISERIAAEELVHKNEEIYKNLVEKLPDGVYKSTHDGKFVNVNPAMVKMLGYESKEELMAIDIKNELYFTISDRESVILQENLKEVGTYRMRRKNGIEIWVEDHGWLSFDKNTGILYHEGVMRDVTERRKSEEKIRMLAHAIRSISECVSITDMNDNILFVNNAFLKTYQFEEKELIGNIISIIRSANNSTEEVQQILPSTRKGKWQGEVLNKRKDGSEFPVFLSTSIIQDENGVPVALIGVASDITERKQLEKQMKLLGRAVEQSPVTVVITDKEGTIEYANPKFTEITGYTLEEVIGKNPRVLNSGSHPKDFYVNLWNTILSGKDWHGEFHNLKKDGASYWESAVISPIVNSSGDISSFIAVKEDITEKKKMVEELIKAKENAEESDRLKSAFLANMSHEIRTPMNGILGFAELLKQPGLTGTEQLEYLQIIKKSGDRMLNIINDIVDISKIESGQMKTLLTDTDINETTSFIYNFFKPEIEGKGIKFIYNEFESDAKVIIKTDKEKVYAVLTNLVKNAIKYCDNGTIELGYRIKDQIKPAEIEFFVRDTGIGVPKNRMLAIFDRFVQADIGDKRAFQGAGLGLSISKAYVEMLGGRLWIESEEGKGSVFYFTIPYIQRKAIDLNPYKVITMTDEDNGKLKLKVLIAEDDETSEILVRMAIKDISKEIIVVQTGSEAIELCRTNPDIDLVLMDIKMPVMDGYEATQLIREFNKDVIIIAQTAFGMSGDRTKAIDAGCNDYISKPLNIAEMKSVIQNQFNRK